MILNKLKKREYVTDHCFSNTDHSYAQVIHQDDKYITAMTTMETLASRADYTKALQTDGLAIMEGVTTTCGNCDSFAAVLNKLMKK